MTNTAENVHDLNILEKAQDLFTRGARFLRRHSKPVMVTVVTVSGSALASAQTDATVIATNAQSAFATIAPITITIAGFYVILKIAKKVVH